MRQGIYEDAGRGLKIDDMEYLMTALSKAGYPLAGMASSADGQTHFFNFADEIDDKTWEAVKAVIDGYEVGAGTAAKAQAKQDYEDEIAPLVAPEDQLTEIERDLETMESAMMVALLPKVARDILKRMLAREIKQLKAQRRIRKGMPR